MDDLGSITIDNKNLLDDFLGLNTDNVSLKRLNSKNQFGDNQELEYFFSNRENNLDQANRAENKTSIHRNLDSAGSYSQVPVNRFYLESPTFTKAEDDIYRYVYKY